MKATLLLHEKIIDENGAIVEMKVWKVPVSEAYPLGVKYSLYCLSDKTIIAGYDNHYPKGPHCHYGNQEVKYDFVSVEKLIADFRKDMVTRRESKKN